ncbi:MAG: hypothetical protein PGN19_03710 [Pseudomonas oryzihabitans]
MSSSRRPVIGCYKALMFSWDWGLAVIYLLGFVAFLMILLVILMLLVFIYGFIYLLYRKLPFWAFWPLILVVIFILFSGFKTWKFKQLSRSVPYALQVEKITYAKEESWGFGPGGNETGIRLFELPNEISQKINAAGLKFFSENTKQNNLDNRGQRASYSNWAVTPIKSDVHWKPDKKSGLFRVMDYFCTYGFCIDIEPEVEKQVNEIVNTPGCYYSYGRIGLIVVCPGRNLVAYLYNG